jgi:hypothetical protein
VELENAEPRRCGSLTSFLTLPAVRTLRPLELRQAA